MQETYEYKWIGISNDMEATMNTHGKDGWYPSSLPPANTTFGPKVLLQRKVLVPSDVLEQPTKQLLMEEQKVVADERLADLQRRFGI